MKGKNGGGPRMRKKAKNANGGKNKAIKITNVEMTISKINS